jgi:hypothetical protein
VLSIPYVEIPADSNINVNLQTLNTTLTSILTLLETVITGPGFVSTKVYGSVGVINYDFIPLEVVGI